MECFICCTKHGKSENQVLYEIYMNDYTIDYPIISLSYAYGCECKNMFAHNICLYSINKCPQCRKVKIPNIMAKTRIEFLKPYLTRIKCILYIPYILFLLIVGIIMDEYYQHRLLNDIGKICLLVVIIIIYRLHQALIDTIRKYWLIDLRSLWEYIYLRIDISCLQKVFRSIDVCIVWLLKFHRYVDLHRE